MRVKERKMIKFIKKVLVALTEPGDYTIADFANPKRIKKEKERENDEKAN